LGGGAFFEGRGTKPEISIASRKPRGRIGSVGGPTVSTFVTAMGKRSLQLLVVMALLGGTAKSTPAQSHDPRQEILSAEDFRVRVGAALALGRSHAPDARQYLERALADSHPTVRTAAAAALGALKDVAAVGALERRLGSEPSESVRSQMRATIASLRAGAASPSGPAVSKSTRYAIHLGSMKNLSGVRGPELGNVMRVTAQRRAAELKGALLVDDLSALKAGPKGVPMLVLDGSLTKLAQQSQSNGSVAFTARVEFTVRKVPENTLKGALSGAATSLGTAKSLTARSHLFALQDQAVEGAVESAMRGANEGLMQAAR
jgi:hypothetical protein